MDTNTIGTRIEQLNTRLKAKASYLAGASPEHTPDDIYQEMVLALLSKADRDPTFAKQKSGYLMKYADWCARKNGQSSRTYRNYVDDMPTVTNENGDTVTLAETIASNDLSPEQYVEFAEDAGRLIEVVSDLTPENQTLVKMLYYGHEQVEIAQVLGITKGAVSQRKKTVARAIATRLSA